MTNEAKIHIEASPDSVYAMVADITRMGEWSPENTGGKWLGGASGAAVGARFRGTNRAGIAVWATNVTVTAAEPGRAHHRRAPGAARAGPGAATRWTSRGRR